MAIKNKKQVDQKHIKEPELKKDDNIQENKPEVKGDSKKRMVYKDFNGTPVASYE